MRDTIVNDRSFMRDRKPPRHIIIVPTNNMTTYNTYIDPKVLISTHRYSWGSFQEYMWDQLGLKMPLMHYYCELLDDDYVFFVGIGLESNSPYLMNLASTGAISHIYKNAVCIAVNDDYRIDVPDRRMLKGLSNYVIAPLLWLYKMDRNNVLFIDDILNPNAEELVKKNKDKRLHFKLEKSKYYDNNQLIFQLKEYSKR